MVLVHIRAIFEVISSFAQQPHSKLYANLNATFTKPSANFSAEFLRNRLAIGQTQIDPHEAANEILSDRAAKSLFVWSLAELFDRAACAVEQRARRNTRKKNPLCKIVKI